MRNKKRSARFDGLLQCIHNFVLSLRIQITRRFIVDDYRWILQVRLLHFIINILPP